MAPSVAERFSFQLTNLSGKLNFEVFKQSELHVNLISNYSYALVGYEFVYSQLGVTPLFGNLGLVHTNEISTSTNARHTHGHKRLGLWMTNSASAYAWLVLVLISPV